MIDFKQKIEEKELHNNHKEYIKPKKRTATYLTIAIVIILIFFGRIVVSDKSTSNWFSANSFLGKIVHLVTSKDKALQGEDDDRINVLLLGMGGKGHDGAYLTDTIILASIQPSTKKVSLISIPRDLIGPINNSSSWQKVNHINAYAERDNSGSGGKATIQGISHLLQIDIPYYIRVDFSGFTKIIDQLGGVKINVENSFDDYTYPINGEEANPDYNARFEHLHFETGPQKMTGSLALKYARSRHASGIEGSDFARAKRQQLLLEAIKEKLLSKKTLLNPLTLSKLITQFKNNVSTNLKTWEMLKLWDIIKDVNKENINNKVLNDAPNNYLVSSIGEDGAFILIPKTGNFTEIRRMIRNVFPNTNSHPSIEQKDLGNDSKVVIINGTWINGLAGEEKTELEKYNYNIPKITNAPTRDYTNNIIYDFSSGRKDKALKGLQTISDAKQIYNAPNWIKDYKEVNNIKIDFLLILGTNTK